MAGKLFGRRLDRVFFAVKRPSGVLGSLYAIRRFRRPAQLLRCYLTRTCPASLEIETRSGYRLALSGDEDDPVVVITVLGRGDYGVIPKDGTIIDVGAHLGAFSVYAISQGARRVYAFEPDPQLNKLLNHNLAINGMGDSVYASDAAVVGNPLDEPAFYPEGNASGHMGKRQDHDVGIAVPIMTLSDILRDNQIERVDLLKLDCEGSEYGILFDTPGEVFTRIERLCLEYHCGQTDLIRNRLAALGFVMTVFRRHSENSGLMSFSKPPSMANTSRDRRSST